MKDLVDRIAALLPSTDRTLAVRIVREVHDHVAEHLAACDEVYGPPRDAAHLQGRVMLALRHIAYDMSAEAAARGA